jgi:hypothetical protein
MAESLAFSAAEDVLLQTGDFHWQQIVEMAYQSEAMAERMAQEQKGVRDILEGRYCWS